MAHTAARLASGPAAMLHPPERRLQLLLAGHAILSAVLACLYLASGDTGVLGALPNSFAKDALFVALSALGAADVRRRAWFALLVALASSRSSPARSRR